MEVGHCLCLHGRLRSRGSEAAMVTLRVTLVHEVEATGRGPALRAESEQNLIGRRQGQRFACRRTEAAQIHTKHAVCGR